MPLSVVAILSVSVIVSMLGECIVCRNVKQYLCVYNCVVLHILPLISITIIYILGPTISQVVHSCTSVSYTLPVWQCSKSDS